MTWTVGLHDDFLAEYDQLPQGVQDELLAKMGLLEQFGPQLRRPHVDTLKGSRHDNMKELRLNAADAAWRFLFAFDPNRSAIVFCGGSKSGGSEDLFYRKMVTKADSRFDAHLAQIQAKKTKGKKQRKTTQIRKQK
ncbi:MAG: type II toxin-antitoxin system RelE/ParE family toxin [Verrucomicrobia bacterium]|nr:type II toxin-antitoxin system RelE/ParE family toxin [Verrucomicrobiota bacterium]MBV8277558.1 type II toxin-antitoxin system RelE/ParE family toxin [Verrucomicrobiota bacterium]